MTTHEVDVSTPQLSLLHGPSDPPLISQTLSTYLDQQCVRFGDRECLVTPWNGERWTYNDVQRHSLHLASYLLSVGIETGDRVAILAGNRAEYVSVFFACMRVGAVLVILNNTYTTSEAEFALQHSGEKLLRAHRHWRTALIHV